MAQILVLHGPNLNLLGTREPTYYGHQTLETINDSLTQLGAKLDHTITTIQSNSEVELIDIIQQTDCDLLIFNPAALTHTSIALRDALLARELPFIEVHLSNIYSREPFRSHSYFSDIALAVISGFGAQSYEFALQSAARFLQMASTKTQRSLHGHPQS